MSDWRDDHEHDPLEFEDEEPQAPTRASGEGVRILGPDEPATEPAERPADDSEEFWGERAIDFDLPEDGDAPTLLRHALRALGSDKVGAER